MVNVCLLGCGGMMPLPDRHLTALMLAVNGKMLLIDCGEGTQISLKILGWGFKDIDTICFTHYHADHISGLPGLLLTIGNSGKTEPLTLIGPKGLQHVVNSLRVIAPELPYEIKFVEISSEKPEFFKSPGFDVYTLPLDHSITCIGYKIEVKRGREFHAERAESENIPRVFWSKLQKGEEVNFGDKLYTPEMVLGEERKGIKICYCTDTRPIESLVPFIKEADLFVCEGMYGDDEKLSKAEENKHMLFSEAAKLALEGNVKELWLTHYSPSITFPEEYMEKTRSIFYNSRLGEDRMIKSLKFEMH